MIKLIDQVKLELATMFDCTLFCLYLLSKLLVVVLGVPETLQGCYATPVHRDADTHQFHRAGLYCYRSTDPTTNIIITTAVPVSMSTITTTSTSDNHDSEDAHARHQLQRRPTAMKITAIAVNDRTTIHTPSISKAGPSP